MDALEVAFGEVLGPERGDVNTRALGERLRAALTQGRTAHPGLVVPDEAFVRHLARGVAASLCELEALAIEDLYLACACDEGAAGAVARFESRYAPVIKRSVSRVLSNPADSDEAIQRSRQALLVHGGDGSGAKISQYLGKGPLENWVAVVAIRMAVSLGRSESAERRVRDLAVAEATGKVDPEALFMNGQIRRELEAAVGQALERLEDKQRLVLRLYLVSGMTLTAIAKSAGVKQQTISNWLAKARKSILADVRRYFGKRLRVPAGDLAAIAGLVASQIDVSISRVLDTGREEPWL